MPTYIIISAPVYRNCFSREMNVGKRDNLRNIDAKPEHENMLINTVFFRVFPLFDCQRPDEYIYGKTVEKITDNRTTYGRMYKDTQGEKR